jgi:hypothetical protein
VRSKTRIKKHMLNRNVFLSEKLFGFVNVDKNNVKVSVKSEDCLKFNDKLSA